MRSPEHHSDDRLQNDARVRISDLASTTALLTAIAAAILGVLVLVARVETRTRAGDRREMRVIDVWREAVQSIPSDAPSLFTPVLMAALLIGALIGIAYLIVAILRLPR